MSDPALGILEINSIAKGIQVTDTILKKAPIHVIESASVTPGKFIILFTSDVASVDEALCAGIDSAGVYLIDKTFIPNIHENVIQALLGKISKGTRNSLGVVETSTIASIILAADMACKAANVDLLRIQLARGIGGKGFFILSGDLNNIQASIECAIESTKVTGTLVHSEIIPAPDSELYEKVLQ